MSIEKRGAKGDEAGQMGGPSEDGKQQPRTARRFSIFPSQRVGVETFQQSLEHFSQSISSFTPLLTISLTETKSALSAVTAILRIVSFFKRVIMTSPKFATTVMLTSGESRGSPHAKMRCGSASRRILLSIAHSNLKGIHSTDSTVTP